MRAPSGYTLIETVVVLALTGALCAFSAPPLLRWRDAAAVRAARDEVAAAFAAARVEAIARGGATVVVDPATARLWTTFTGAAGEAAVDLRARYGAALDAGGDGLVRIRYDGLGIGRLASRRITVRRGGAAAGVTVSAYGRVRRW